MFSNAAKLTDSPVQLESLVCSICDLQQSTGQKNWYCYQCDQLYFSELSDCSSPMSRHSRSKKFKDDESVDSPREEEAEVHISKPVSVFQPYPSPHAESWEASGHQYPAPWGYGLSEQSSQLGFLPFAYNHGLAMPTVDRFEPSNGSAGVPVNVYLKSDRDLSLNPAPSPMVLFGNLKTHSQLFAAEGYEAIQPHQAPKLRRSSSASAVTDPSVKRSASQAPAWPSVDRYSHSQHLEQPSPSPLSPHFQQPPFTEPRAQPATAYPGMLQGQQTPQYAPISQGESLPGFTGSSSASSMQTASHTVPSQAYSVPMQHQDLTSHATQFGPVRYAAAPISPTDFPGSGRAPSLRRPASHSRLKMETSAPHFNPYSIPRATLELEGDLNDMLKNWSREERQTRRRIVAFDRKQTGSVINASFHAVALDDWSPESINVSCIWWAEKREAFITSVDLISLLESIVGLRFTLQEKNRIRRNLEGFKPYTVGKSKPEKEQSSVEAEAFFEVIMGLGEPKPRSIEKDVKVFPWKTLAAAMKKVVDKYSASYASTAGTLHPSSSHPRLESSELSRRPSASHSDGASSSARSAEPDSGVEPARPTLAATARTSGMPLAGHIASEYQHQHQQLALNSSFSSWASSGDESGTPAPTSNPTQSPQHYGPHTSASQALDPSTTAWQDPAYYYMAPGAMYPPREHSHPRR